MNLEKREYKDFGKVEEIKKRREEERGKREYKDFGKVEEIKERREERLDEKGIKSN